MHPRSFCLAALSVCLAAAFASADAPPTIERVRIGLPATGKSADNSGRSRNAAWAPVAVLVKSSAGHPQNAYRLRIETTDPEEQVYQYAVPVPSMAANTEGVVTGYIVPGSDAATFRVQLETAEDNPRVVSFKDKITRESTRNEQVGEHDVLFLGAGSGLASLKAVSANLDKAQERDDRKRPDKKEAEPLGDLLRGKRQFAFAEDVAALPDRWYGYDAVDVVILATGKVDYVNALAADAVRHKALQEWVQRGGQLVISVGRNQAEVGNLLAKMRVLRIEFAEAARRVATLPALSKFAQTLGHVEPLSKVEVATLAKGAELRAGAHVIVREEEAGPVMLEASYGLGRVVLLCFDLDSAEFAAWKGQDEFWKQTQLLVSPHLPIAHNENDPNDPRRFRGMGRMRGGNFQRFDDGFAEPLDMKPEMKRSLERFEEIPTVSFGWVMLFLLLFIALVGPLDYLLLKKVFKRLELTWVTFPIIVVMASVVAYVAAYSLKGEELRVNKIDLIDVDLHQPQQVYGNSWFTLFSPRAQSYTVGVEPGVGWAGPMAKGEPGPVVTLLEGGDNTRRQASQGLFRRPYEYADDATGLKYVPVPVWSTRSFTASWRAPLLTEEGKSKPPIGAAGMQKEDGMLSAAREGTGLVGHLTNNLGVTLKDVCLFYQDKWYLVGDLQPGEPKAVVDLFSRDAIAKPGKDFAAFFTSGWNAGNEPPVLQPGMPLFPQGFKANEQFRNRMSYAYVKQMMFYQRMAGPMNNSGMRQFDQSWRLGKRPQFPQEERTRFREEAILVARAPLLTGPESWSNKHAGTGTRLWLGKLPVPGEEPPAMPGVVVQETYLRVFVPVKR